MIYLEISTHVISSGPYCKKHAKEALEKYNREYFHACVVCGVEAFGYDRRFCTQHNNDYYRHEYERVKSQIGRTIRLKLPSTLTLSEWLKIIEQHDGKCAYCKGKGLRKKSGLGSRSGHARRSHYACLKGWRNRTQQPANPMLRLQYGQVQRRARKGALIHGQSA